MVIPNDNASYMQREIMHLLEWHIHLALLLLRLHNEVRVTSDNYLHELCNSDLMSIIQLVMLQLHFCWVLLDKLYMYGLNICRS